MTRLRLDERPTATRSPVHAEVELRVGQRIRMSALGMARFPRFAFKIGVVVALTEKRSTITVRFDGNRTKTSIHRNYIEPLAP
jgi:hypothetical protein